MKRSKSSRGVLCVWYQGLVFFLLSFFQYNVIAIATIKLCGKNNYSQWVTSVEVFLKVKRKKYLVMKPTLSDDKGFEV